VNESKGIQIQIQIQIHKFKQIQIQIQIKSNQIKITLASRVTQVNTIIFNADQHDRI
jgi:hypothetical protein